MNFRQLQFVVKIVECGSFTRAAEQCFVTQPALSNAVRLLEDELGGRLFSRTPGNVHLTPFGKEVLPKIEAVLAAQATLHSAANEQTARLQQMVRVGLSPLISGDILGDNLERTKSLMPDVEVVLIEMNAADLGPQLTTRSIDLAVGPIPIVADQSKRMSLYDEPLLCVRSEKPSTRESTPLAEIADETFIMVPDNCGLARVTRQIFSDAGLELKEYSGRALGYHMLEKWARLGLGAALLPASKVTDTAYACTVEDGDGKTIVLEIEVAWRPGDELSDALDSFLQALRLTGHA